MHQHILHCPGISSFSSGLLSVFAVCHFQRLLRSSIKGPRRRASWESRGLRLVLTGPSLSGEVSGRTCSASLCIKAHPHSPRPSSRPQRRLYLTPFACLRALISQRSLWIRSSFQWESCPQVPVGTVLFPVAVAGRHSWL